MFAGLARVKIAGLAQRQPIEAPPAPEARQSPPSPTSTDNDPGATAALSTAKEPNIGSRDSDDAPRRLSGEELRSLFSTERRARGDLPPPVYVSTLASPYPNNSVVIKYQPDGNIHAIWTVRETGTWKIEDDLLCMS